MCIYRVHGTRVRETLGTATVPKVEDARNLARMQKAQAGTHPVEERQLRPAAARRLDTLDRAMDHYFAVYAVHRMRPASFAEIRRTLERDVKPVLGSKSLQDI